MKELDRYPLARGLRDAAYPQVTHIGMTGHRQAGRATTAAVMAVPAVAGLPDLDHAPASAADGGLGGEPCRGSHDGPWRRAGTLLACGGRCDVIVVAWPPTVMTASPPVPVACGRWLGLPGSASASRVRAAWQPGPRRCLPVPGLSYPGSALVAVPAWPGSRSFKD